MNAPLFLIIIFLFFHTQDAFCVETEHPFISEACHVNNNNILLYKIINWWNDSPPEEDTLPCGDPIKCQNIGNTQVAYSAAEMMLNLQIIGEFGELISVFKQCEQCSGPSYFKCTWLNTQFFGNVETTTSPIISRDIKILSFQGISPQQAHHLKNIEKDLAFVVEGVIGGLLLLDGRIALHQSGKFLKICPKSSQSQKESFPISLKIINSRTQEEIAKYQVIFDHYSQ